jgi:hypothetical protein
MKQIDNRIYAKTFQKAKQEKAKNINPGIRWMFMVIGLICLAFGVKNFFDEKALIATYEPATATLSELNLDPTSKYKPPLSYCPVFKYTTQDGKPRAYSTRNCVNNPDLHAFGEQQVQIYYNPGNPDAPVETTGLFGTEGSGLIVGIVGFIFLGLILLIWIVSERIQERRFKRKNTAGA